MTRIGIVIASCSAKIAAGTAELVRHAVGTEVPVAFVGGKGNEEVGIEAGAIAAAIKSVWSDKGVAVFVDLGSTERESEVAIATLPGSYRRRVALCNAPLVEGALMAATEAFNGGNLETVRRVVEDW